jgi:hypothetical protein
MMIKQYTPYQTRVLSALYFECVSRLNPRQTLELLPVKTTPWKARFNQLLTLSNYPPLVYRAKKGLRFLSHFEAMEDQDVPVL